MDELNITDIYSGNADRSGQGGSNRFTKETGFPSPAQDHYEKSLSLDEYIIRHPAATYFVRVEGDSMQKAGILSGDILVVDRSVKPVSGHLIVVLLDTRYTIKQLEKRGRGFYLCSGLSSEEEIPITDDLDYEIWGVVTYAIHKYV